VSENEGEVRTARQMRALVQVAKSGRAWGAPCFGYGTDNRNPAIIPEEAAAIRQAYKDLLAGATLYSIAKTWNTQGFRTRPRADRPDGNQWQGTTVRRLLDNPRMAGLRRHRGEIVGKGDWEPIVDEATWEMAHHILSDPRRRSNTTQVRKYLLGGILRCGGCGDGLSSAWASGRGKGYAQYKCKRHEKTGRPCPHGVTRKLQPLEDYVRDLVIKKVSERDWVPPGGSISNEAAKELHEEAAKVRTKLDQLVEDYADDTLSKRAYLIAKERNEGKLESIQMMLNRSARSRIYDGFIGLSDPVKVAEVYDAMPIDRQRTLLEGLFEKIVVNPLGVSGWAAKKLPIGTKIRVFWASGSADS
jgi:hypothetical protein